MAPKLTKAQARRFRRRWQLVNAYELQELRSTSIEVKWQQFNTLWRLARACGWLDSLAKDDAEVRARWMRLRKVFRGKKSKKDAS